MSEKMLKFVKIGQQTPPKRDVNNRKDDFNEIYDEFISDKAKLQSSRCSQCGVPFCQVHCPLSNNIPDWLKLTAEGRLQEAYELSQSTNNMPEVCGRICPQDRLCEGNCVIEQSGHGTVTIGSMPLIVFGFVIYITGVIDILRDVKIIAWTTIAFGILLYFADKNKLELSIDKELSIKSIFIIGLFQVLSLIPGVSRAGIVITGARFLKYNRIDSAKISFLLSIPALCGASVLSLNDILKQNVEFNYLVILAIVLSFFFSFITVKFFLEFIKKFSLNIFVFYRITLGLVLLFLIY